MIRLAQHALVASALALYCWNWLRLLLFYSGIEELNRIEGAAYARQKEQLQHRALQRVVPLAALYCLLYLPYWHLYDGHFHTNETARFAARMQAPPAGCHLPDHYLEQTWTWQHFDMHQYADSLFGTHWSETACADYLHRTTQAIEPSYLLVFVELLASPFVVLMDVLGKGVALFLDHQRLLALLMMGVLAPVVLFVVLVLAGPYLVTAGAWARTALQPAVDRVKVRKQAALNYIRYPDIDDEQEVRTRRGVLRLREEGYKLPMASHAVSAMLMDHKEEAEREWSREEEI